MPSLASRAARASSFSSSPVLLGLGLRRLEEKVGIEGGAVLPHRPQSFEDFSLGVEPCVAGGAGPFLALLVEAADHVALVGAADAGTPSMVRNGLEFLAAPRVKPFVSEGLAVAGAFGDPQGTEAVELMIGGEAGRIFDHRAEDMGADIGDAGHSHEMGDLRVILSHLFDLVELFDPGTEGGVEDVVKAQETLAAGVGHPLEPFLALARVKDFPAVDRENA